MILLTSMIIPSHANAAGGKFEGVITYNISFPNTSIPEEQMAMFPKTMTLTVKGSNTRNETVSARGNRVIISNFDKKFTVSLTDINGKKLAIMKTLDDINKDNDKRAKPTIQLTSETKVIAGYKCKKAVVTIERNGDKSSLEIWYTNELGGKELNFGNPDYKEIDGMLMEYSIDRRSFTMKYSVSKIEKKSVAASLFEIPSGYTVTTEAEMRSMQGGGGR